MDESVSEQPSDDRFRRLSTRPLQSMSRPFRGPPAVARCNHWRLSLVPDLFAMRRLHFLLAKPSSVPRVGLQ